MLRNKVLFVCNHYPNNAVYVFAFGAPLGDCFSLINRVGQVFEQSPNALDYSVIED